VRAVTGRKGKNIKAWLKRNWFYVGMGAVLVVGYSWGGAGRLLSDNKNLLIAGLMFVSGLGLSPQGILLQLRNPRALGLFLLVSYGLAPLVAYGVASLLFRSEPGLFTGLIIMGSTAVTLSSCIIWTRLAGGNDGLALVMSILGNFLQFLVTPTWLSLLLRATVKIAVGDMMWSLLTVLVLPLIASQVVVVVLGRRAPALRPATNVVGRLLVLSVIWVAVYNARDELLTKEALYSSFAVAVVHLTLLATAWWVVGRLLPSRGDRIALLFCGGQKTLPSSTYIAKNFFGNVPGTMLPVLLYHFWQLVIDSLLLERLPQHEHAPGETRDLVSGDG
jgi:sodium/bile acid cotransporter 7